MIDELAGITLIHKETMRQITFSSYFSWRRLGVFCVIMLNSMQLYSQHVNNEIFGPVPEAQRSGFIERLNLLIEYQKKQEWAKQYDLFSSSMTRAEGKRDFINRTRQAYSKWGRAPLLAFTPYKVAMKQVDARQKVWFIAGCAEVLKKGQRSNELAQVEAYWEKNNWFFSELVNYGTGDGNDPCSQVPLKAYSASSVHPVVLNN
jgi:hypothetical protein